MKRKILFFLLCLLPFMSYAQLQGTYSKYVGEYQDLEVSTAASQIYSIDWKKWSGDVECVTLIQNWGNDATVHIDEYFTGTIRIRAQYKTMSNAIKTEYFDIRCNAVTLSPSPSSISLSKVGETEFITYTKSPSNKFPTVEYSSSNPNVATVGFSSGLVTAIAKGSATITLKNSMGPDAKVSVSVAGGGGSSGGGDSGGGGSSDEDTYTQLTTEEGDLMWVCSTKLNNENVYVVEVPPFIASGFSCVAKSIAGKVTIPSGWGGRSVRKIKAYAFNYLSGITEVVIPSTLKYIENNSFAYCSSLKTITCYAVEPPTGSSLNHISTYDSETTLYVPSATAKAKYQNAPGWCNFKEIKVIGESDPIVPTSISVSPSTKTIEVGDGFYCSYTISPSDANSQTSVTWTSDDSSIASVSSSGYVTGKKAGKTYINATTANGKTAWCTVTVTSSTPSTIVPTSITVSPSSKTIEVGGGFYCSYTISPSNANSQTSVTWTSDDSSIASVSSSGYVTGKKAGKTYINATTANGQTSWCTVTVTSSGSSTIVPTSISVSPSTKTIEVGDGFYCSYTISPSNANSQTSVTWTSDDSSIASVSSSGYVTGKKVGSTYINATTANGKSDWCKVAVTSSESSTIVPTSISVSPSTKTIEVGDGFYCSYTISPSNANSETSVTWSSDDSSIATVSSSGYVTGKKAGSTYINAKTANGKTDWCKVTVTASQIPQIQIIKQIELGGYFSMILKTDGTLWACGENYDGQLGDGTTTDRKTPVKVMSDVAQVSAGTYHTIILKTDGTLWACGDNLYGQLGDGTYTDRKTPVKVMSDVAQVSAGYEHSMILKTDGSLWACGENYDGQLGDGTTTDRNTPVKVMTDVAQMSTGGYHSMIVKNDGTLWACGDNYDGQLGDGTYTDRKTPVKVMSDVAQVSAGYEHSMILKTDGTLWACGRNYHGQLGDGTTTDRKTPIKVMSDVAQVSAGYDHSMILKTDGTLWACGYNKYGQLGDGTTTDRTSFVKIAEPNITENEITVKMPDAGYATFYSAQSAYSLPRNLSAQVVTNASDNKLTYKTIADGSVSGVIPVGTPVMLVSDNKQAGTYTLTSTESKVSYSGTNLLRGSDEPTTSIGDGYHYKLSYGQSGSNLSNVFGWYWGAQNGAPFQIEGHKAWLVVPKSSSSTRGFAIGGEATGIEMVSGDDNVEADAVYYDLQGRRVTKPTVKGVYIKNGKKVMVK